MGSADLDELGERLYNDLFGDLREEERKKQAWLLSVEDALFDLPFAALVTKRNGGPVSYLVQQHSLQFVPGALLMHTTAPPQRGAWFLGVGDPIYNSADPRWLAISESRGFPSFFMRASGRDGVGQFARLVASALELESSAESWSGSGMVVLLQGAEARRDKFLKLAGDRPSVIHLATHVLTPNGRRGQAFIAFGLDSVGHAEFLSTSDVAMLRVPGALVIMTGCQSGGGEIHAGAGLLGLTRAWQMAGSPSGSSYGVASPGFER
jgi:CHAT domain-containing protein